MILFSVALWLQDPTPILTTNETRFILWLVAGLLVLIGAVVTFGSKHLFGLMHEDRKERHAVMQKVEKVADDHREEMKEIYSRITDSNATTTASLSEMSGRLFTVETIIHERLPAKPRRRATA